MAKIVNIDKCFSRFADTFSPKIVGDLNGQLVMVVRLEGDKVPWHAHESEDEMFLVVDGVLEVHEEGECITLHAGEFCIVRRGIRHRVVPRGHVKLLLIEPDGIAHTGNVQSEITRKSFERLE